MDQSIRELEITDDLRVYATKIAITVAKKNGCPRFIEYDDIVQDTLLNLLRKPIMYDPTRGAKPTTLIYTIVERAVVKFITREKKQARRFNFTHDRSDMETASDISARVDMSTWVGDDRKRNDPDHPTRRPMDAFTKSFMIDDVLKFIDDEESRELCLLVMKCDGNVSKVARLLKLDREDVRYKLNKLGPKLIAAGFDLNSSWNVPCKTSKKRK